MTLARDEALGRRRVKSSGCPASSMISFEPRSDRRAILGDHRQLIAENIVRPHE
jgi:hypothetical protein